MKALDLLRADHRQLSQLFEQLRQTDDFSERRELFEEVRDRLEEHSGIEEAIFYPRFSRLADLEELMSESIEDHRLMTEILGELSSTYEVDDFNDLLEELMDTVEDHIAEEEDEVFPRVIEMLSDREWDQLAMDMIERREGLRAA